MDAGSGSNGINPHGRVLVENHILLDLRYTIYLRL